MIELDLQKFAKTKSYQSYYRQSIRKMKQSMPGTSSKDQSDKKKETPEYKKGRITDIDIKDDEEYVLYQVKNANDKNEIPKKKGLGSTINNLIDKDKIWYDAKRHVWVMPDGKQNEILYVLRKRRR